MIEELTLSQKFLEKKIDEILEFNPFPRSMFFICGATGVGKTFFAKEFCQKRKFKYVFTPEKDLNEQIVRPQGFIDYIRNFEDSDEKSIIIDGLDASVSQLMDNQQLSGVFTSLSRDIPENPIFLIIKITSLKLAKDVPRFPTLRFLSQNWPNGRLFILDFTLNDLKHIAKAKNMLPPLSVDPNTNAWVLYSKYDLS